MLPIQDPIFGVGSPRTRAIHIGMANLMDQVAMALFFERYVLKAILRKVRVENNISGM